MSAENAMHTLVMAARGNPIVMECVRKVDADRRVLAAIVRDLAAGDVLSAVGDLGGGWYVVCNWCAATWNPPGGDYSREAFDRAAAEIVHDRDCLGWRARRWVAEFEAGES